MASPAGSEHLIPFSTPYLLCRPVCPAAYMATPAGGTAFNWSSLAGIYPSFSFASRSHYIPIVDIPVRCLFYFHFLTLAGSI